MSVWDRPLLIHAGQRARLLLGARVMWAERRTGQWLLGGRDVVDDGRAEALLEVVPAGEVPPEDGAVTSRIAAAGAESELRILPRPPDRPVVARPELALTVPSGQTTRVFVGVPVWISAVDRGQTLTEVASVALSETWFGNPREGELGYATRTFLSMDLSTIPRRPYRALCPCEVRNESDEPLVLERVRLPAPSLSVFEDAAGQLWTCPVKMVRGRAEGLAEVSVSDKAPREAPGARRLGGPRVPWGEPLLSRVFNAVWGAA